MTIRWKTVGWISSALVAAGLALYGMGLVAQHDQQARLREKLGPTSLLPLTTGFGSVNGPVDPHLHCTTLPLGIRIADQPTSKARMDHHFQGYPDWTVISDRMTPGDDIYAYNSIPHPPPGVTSFTGQGGGYVVLRGWCLIGRFNSWVE